MRNVLFYKLDEGSTNSYVLEYKVLLNSKDISILDYLSNRLTDSIELGDIYWDKQTNELISKVTRTMLYEENIKKGVIIKNTKTLSKTNKYILKEDGYISSTKLLTIDYKGYVSTEFVCIQKSLNLGKYLPINDLESFYLKDLHEDKVYMTMGSYLDLINNKNLYFDGVSKAIGYDSHEIVDLVDYDNLRLYDNLQLLFEIYNANNLIKFIKSDTWINSLYSLKSIMTFNEYKYIDKLLSNINSLEVGVQLFGSYNYSNTTDKDTYYYFRSLCTKHNINLHSHLSSHNHFYSIYNRNNSTNDYGFTIPYVKSEILAFDKKELFNILVEDVCTTHNPFGFKSELSIAAIHDYLGLVNSKIIKDSKEYLNKSDSIKSLSTFMDIKVISGVSKQNILELFNSKTGIDLSPGSKHGERYKFIIDNLVNLYNF